MVGGWGWAVKRSQNIKILSEGRRHPPDDSHFGPPISYLDTIGQLDLALFTSKLRGNQFILGCEGFLL